MREAREAERLRREAWEGRRRSTRAGWESAIDALYVQLFGDPRNADDRGYIGENTARIARLERIAAWITALLVTTLITVIVDLIIRLSGR